MDMKTGASGWHRRVPNHQTGPSTSGVLERDRLGRFFPALLALTVLAAALEAVAAILLQEPALAASAGSTALAEGIETAAEQETLQHLGVTLGQGYHLARPAPVDAWRAAITTESNTPPTRKVIPIRSPISA
jgi:hypothetical protein